MQLTLFDQAVQPEVNSSAIETPFVRREWTCESYIVACCDATLRNPPQCNPRWSDPEDFLDGVRYYARLDGHGLAKWPEDECKKHLHYFWNAYIKSTFSTKYLKAAKNLTAKKLYKWILDARREATTRLTPVAPDRAEARDGDDESPTRAAGEHDG